LREHTGELIPQYECALSRDFFADNTWETFPMSSEEEGKAYTSYKVSKCEGTMLLFIKGNKILLQTYEHKMKVN
jgi:hypothetical protein